MEQEILIPFDDVYEVWTKFDYYGYGDGYEVSNRGRIKKPNYRNTGKDKILKLSNDKGGYKKIGLWKDGKMKNVSVHRIVALAFLGSCPDGYTVDHIDFNRANNNISNLRYLPANENDSRKSEEGRKRMSDHAKKLNADPEFCKKRDELLNKLNADPEFRKKSAEAIKKKWQDQEYRNKMSEATKKRWDSPEFIEKMKKLHDSQTYKVARAEGIRKALNKPVLQYDKQGNFIREWLSITDASETLGINKSHISECCRGGRKSAGGFQWKDKEVA